MIRVSLRSAAASELEEAFDWYENERPGLGNEFLIEFEYLARRVSENPNQFPVVHKDVRRALFQRFPFSLLFRIIHDEAVVIACFHGRRNPRIWEERL